MKHLIHAPGPMLRACFSALLLPAACATYDGPPLGTYEAAGAEAGADSDGAGSTSGGASGGYGSAWRVPTYGVSGGGVAAGGSRSPAVAGTTGSAGGATTAGGPAAGGATVPAGDAGGDSGAAEPGDLCPGDPSKLTPGVCGCGVPEVATTSRADCHSLKALLVHRYDFEGSGSKVSDSVGIAHGTVVGGALSKLDGKGVVLMSGGTAGAYVDLPNGLLSSLTSATLEAWVTWGGGDKWQRIFDFGDSTHDKPENNPEGGKSYLFVTPSSVDSVAAIGYSLAGSAQQVLVKAGAQLPPSLCQLVVVADASGDKLVLYINGAKAGERTWTGRLSAINDVNVWLGRSQYDHDSEFSGVFHDFRMYRGALNEAQVASSYQGGPDPAFLKVGL